jgi:hypothetical protein
VKRFLLVLALGALVWTLLLRFYFPGYLDPFVPFHIDHYIYLGDSAEGYGLGRYIRTYPRPLGNVLFDLLGRLGIRGMLAPVFLLTLVNAGLLVGYLERLNRRTFSIFAIAFFFVLVFGNPESYASVKEDILAVVCLFCTLLIFHLWQNYVVSGRPGNLAAAIVLAILASYVKETYFAALVLFFLLQSIVHPSKRLVALGMAAVNAAIAAVSLAYNAHLATFVNPHASPTNPYYQDWHPLSILHGLAHLLKWLVLPVPALMVIASLIALAVAKKHRALAISLASLLFIGVILLPHAVLRNHLEDQYAWLGAFFFFTPVLLASFVIPSSRKALAAAGACAVILCLFTLVEYRKDLHGMAGWLRGQEELQQHVVTALPILKANSKPGEHELVLGLTLPFNPFRVPGFVRGYFGPDTRWTVVLPEEFPLKSGLTTQMLHRADLKPDSYDHIFVFDPKAHLAGIYARKDIAALKKCGNFPLPW